MDQTPLPPQLGGVVFDVEGVIAFPDEAALSDGLYAIHPDLSPAVLSALRHGPNLYPLWQDYSVGRLSGDHYWSSVLDAWEQSRGHEALGAMRRLQSEATWAHLDEGVLRVADGLHRAGLKTALLSNSCEDYEPQIARFEQRFDLAHFSHRTGQRKPDPAAYLDLAAALGLSPEALLFVDDKPRNLEAAAALGFFTHHYVDLAGLKAVLGGLGLAQ